MTKCVLPHYRRYASSAKAKSPCFLNGESSTFTARPVSFIGHIYVYPVGRSAFEMSAIGHNNAIAIPILCLYVVMVTSIYLKICNSSIYADELLYHMVIVVPTH